MRGRSSTLRELSVPPLGRKDACFPDLARRLSRGSSSRKGRRRLIRKAPVAVYVCICFGRGNASQRTESRWINSFRKGGEEGDGKRGQQVGLSSSANFWFLEGDLIASHGTDRLSLFGVLLSIECTDL